MPQPHRSRPGKKPRENERVEISGEVDIKILFTRSEQLREIKAQMKNISAGGLFAQTGEPVEEGALADLRFSVGEPAAGANPLGLVKWVEEGKGLGIEFFYGSEEEKEEIKSALRRLLKKLDT
ncbi:MAG: PilZ domain-containing protein [Planctomycetes bacterium]|nr:PilZ domain-containing protein [Planctomycetota bacterium]